MPAIVSSAPSGATRAAKATDLLGGRVQWVVRYQGGNNAGHTVQGSSGRTSPPPHPVGHPHPGVTNVIGNGVVVDPGVLLTEPEGSTTVADACGC